MPTNQKYWDKRAKNERQWIDKNVADDEAFNKVLAAHYDMANDGIDQRISQIYMSLAKRNGVTMGDAMEAIRGEDVKAYQSQAKKIVEQAHKLFKKQGSVDYADFPDEVNKRLRVYNATMRISRLESLKSQMGLEVLQAGLDVSSDITDKLGKDYTQELQRQAGILGKNFVTPSIVEISKIVGAQTAGADFSKRIWANIDVLKAKLDTALTQQMIMGLNPRDVARQLRPLVADSINNAKYASERIARTESARVQTQAQLNSFKKYGYKHCKWIAEPSACSRCLAIASDNEGVYLIKDVPDLPAHANCRCSLSAWYKEDGDSPFDDLSKFTNYDSLENDLKPLSNTWFNKLSKNQKVDVQGYTALAYKELNRNLYDGTQTNIKLNEFSRSLSSSIKAFNLPNNVHSYRSVNPDELDYIKTHKKFNSFKSTGVNLVDVEEFSDDNYPSKIVHFFTPKETSATYIDGHSLVGDEGELLIDKNTNYVWRTNGKGEIEVMMTNG